VLKFIFLVVLTTTTAQASYSKLDDGVVMMEHPATLPTWWDDSRDSWLESALEDPTVGTWQLRENDPLCTAINKAIISAYRILEKSDATDEAIACAHFELEETTQKTMVLLPPLEREKVKRDAVFHLNLKISMDEYNGLLFCHLEAFCRHLPEIDSSNFLTSLSTQLDRSLKISKGYTGRGKSYCQRLRKPYGGNKQKLKNTIEKLMEIKAAHLLNSKSIQIELELERADEVNDQLTRIISKYYDRFTKFMPLSTTSPAEHLIDEGFLETRQCILRIAQQFLAEVNAVKEAASVPL
jgi:hypothetical protein